MSARARFLYLIHNHQPVGNFDHVFELAYERCYAPSLAALEEFPAIKVALHHSGPLLEWIEKNRSAYLDRLGAMVDAGQVELVSGGFYEPILSAISFDDALGQVEMMNDYLKARFGVKPEGIWLAERVWDISLTRITSAASIRYALLDDAHFYYAGIERDELHGYYIAERGNDALALFPIDKNLRYSIPFKEPEENLAYFDQLSSSPKVDVITYGDDGEKFGLWPETYEWVFQRGWLRRFYETMSANQDRVEFARFDSTLDAIAPKGIINPPPASYDEMMEWSLTPSLSERFKQMKKGVAELSETDNWRPFIRGGLWSDYQIKYDESRRIAKRALHISNRLKRARSSAKIEPELLGRIERALYRGECNCAYWHGMFGGLYLPHLRHALYSNLIEADRLLDEAVYGAADHRAIERIDYDGDMAEEIIVSNREVTAIIDPSYGATLIGWDYKPRDFALLNTMTRRFEPYHKDLLAGDGADENASANAPASIHDRKGEREAGIERALFYDKYARRTFSDQLIDTSTAPEKFIEGDYVDRANLATGRYEIDSTGEEPRGLSARLKFVGEARMENRAPEPLALTKEFSITRSRIEVSYLLENRGENRIEGRFVTELNFTLLTDDAPDRFWVGGSIGDRNEKPRLKETIIDTDASSVGLVDEANDLELEVFSESAVTFYRYAVYTVSRSESGFEKTYQGSAIALARPIDLAPGARLKFRLGFEVGPVRR